METISNFLLKIATFQPPPLVKQIFIFFLISFALTTFYFLFKTSWLKELFLRDLIEFLTLKPYGQKKRKIWQKILKRLESPLESEYKLAILEADDFFQKSLEEMGYPGPSLSEKLKRIEPETDFNLEEISQLEEVKKNIIADPDYKLSLEEARRILKIYQRLLKQLNLL